MSDYTTVTAELQAVKLTDSAGKSTEIYIDPATGAQVEQLQDDKFPWRERKRRTLALADAYLAAKMGSHSDKALACSTWLEYLASGDGSERQLHHFNACHLRICPICATRKARVMANRLARIITKVQADHAGTQLIFLTLTVENCTGDKLRAALDQLTKAWFKLMHRRPVMRAIKGWFRAIEITRNRSKDTYHPHIHAILVVEDAYFVRKNGLYLAQDKWVTMWQQSLQVPYRPIVGIQRTKGKGVGAGGSAMAAALEAAKYATKDSDYIAPGIPRAEAGEVARIYTAALKRKRMTAMGGWVLDAAQALAVDVEDDADLVHGLDAEGTLTEETAELLEQYGWHFGVADHVLVDRRPNPAFQGAGQGDIDVDG